jgi:hypothetical protein
VTDARRNRDQLEELVRQAWTLTDAEIDSIRPGAPPTTPSPSSTPGPLVHTPFADRTAVRHREPRRPPAQGDADAGVLPVHLLPPLRQARRVGGRWKSCRSSTWCLLELWYRQFPMLIGTRGLGKTFTLALYILLRLLFTPGSKVVIVASAFRQAKVVFEYMERLWYGSPVLRDLVGGQRASRAARTAPAATSTGASSSSATRRHRLPLGDGKKIRGLRGQLHHRRRVRQRSPRRSTRSSSRASARSRPTPSRTSRTTPGSACSSGWACGPRRWTPRRPSGPPRQPVGPLRHRLLQGSSTSASTGASTGHHQHPGRPVRRLEEVLKGPVPDAFDWRDYSVIRIPYDLVPHGVHGREDHRPGQADVPHVHYLMEYMTRLPATTARASSGGRSSRSAWSATRTTRPARPSPRAAAWTSPPPSPGDPRRRYVYGVDPASSATTSPSPWSSSTPTTAASSTAGPPRSPATARSSRRGRRRSTTSTATASASCAT